MPKGQKRKKQYLLKRKMSSESDNEPAFITSMLCLGEYKTGLYF